MLFWLQNAQTSPCARGISGNRQTLDRIKTVLIGGTCKLFKKLFFVVGLITHGIVFQLYIKPHLLLLYTSIWNHLILGLFVLNYEYGHWIVKFTDKKHSSVYKWPIQCKKCKLNTLFWLDWNGGFSVEIRIRLQIFINFSLGNKKLETSLSKI